jgi:hypothetical protein
VRAQEIFFIFFIYFFCGFSLVQNIRDTCCETRFTPENQMRAEFFSGIFLCGFSLSLYIRDTCRDTRIFKKEKASGGLMAGRLMAVGLLHGATFR